MTIPEWNTEWEKPDPLRGKRGWSGGHYVSVGIAVILFVAALSLLVPAVVKARGNRDELVRINEQLRIPIDQYSGDSLERK